MRIAMFILCALVLVPLSYLVALLRGFLRAKAKMERAD